MVTRSFFKPVFFIWILVFYCCTRSGPAEYEYQVPQKTSDGWQTAHLNDVGMNAGPLTDLMNSLLLRDTHKVHSILLVRHNRLVFEEYFPGYTHPTIGSKPIDFDKDTWHVLSSATKSYTSALLGIAINMGLIKSIDQNVFDFFPELAHLNSGSKAGLTIKHMITMSSGLQWDQITYPILDHRNDIALIQGADDPWEFYLSRPLVSIPGKEFLYSEGSINVVGEIIKRASGIRLDHFAEQYLFTPLGITRHWWALIKPAIGWIWASGDLRQTPRDMAKFGQLYLQHGLWQGQQVIPAKWVEKTAEPCFTFTAPFWSVDHGLVGYSYAWWLKSSEYGTGAYAAVGWGEQFIIVVPAYDLVAVFTGGSYYSEPMYTAHQMMEEFILPALL